MVRVNVYFILSQALGNVVPSNWLPPQSPSGQLLANLHTFKSRFNDRFVGTDCATSQASRNQRPCGYPLIQNRFCRVRQPRWSAPVVDTLRFTPGIDGIK